jgi:hypothetical protein
MPTAMTFSSLRSDIQSYLERGFSMATDSLVYSQIPQFINLAERRITREWKATGFVEVVTGVMIPGQMVYPKPDRWRDTVSINIGTGVDFSERTPVLARSYEYVRAYSPNSAVTGVPKFYADYNYSNWIFGPAPLVAHPFEVIYYGLQPLLDDSNQTNWLTEYAPQVLLYASLAEATRFLKADERIPVWEESYKNALAGLNAEDIARISDRDAFRTQANP